VHDTTIKFTAVNAYIQSGEGIFIYALHAPQARHMGGQMALPGAAGYIAVTIFNYLEKDKIP
jgi:hypothetical protein